LQPDGTYARLQPRDGEPALCMQDTLMQIAMGKKPDLPPLSRPLPARNGRSRKPAAAPAPAKS